MSLKRMKGVIDPITIGFLIAVFGTATVLSLEKADADVETAAKTAQTTGLAAPMVASQD